jgi:endonuclease YncB( thermonuclease family)
VKVDSCEKLRIQLPRNGRVLEVTLTGVGAPEADEGDALEAKRELERRVLGLDVEVWTAFSSDSIRSIKGVVFIHKADVNFTLIELGKCRFKTPPSYSMSNYVACTYRQIEKKAIAGRLGIWAKR